MKCNADFTTTQKRRMNAHLSAPPGSSTTLCPTMVYLVTLSLRSNHSTPTWKVSDLARIPSKIFYI